MSARRYLPVLASLTAHALVLAAIVGPAASVAADADPGDDTEPSFDDGESLEAYLARAADDLDVGEPEVELVGLTVLPDYAEPAAPAPVVAARPVPAAPEAAPVVVPEAPADAADVAGTRAVAEAEPAPEPAAAATEVVAAAEPGAVERDAAPEPGPTPEELAAAEAVVAEAAAAELAAAELAAAELAAAELAAPAKPPRTGLARRHHPRRAGAERPRVFRDADPNDGITRTGRTTWSVERELLDHYATHIPELMKLGSVGLHRGADKKPDGFRVKVKSDLLRATGLRTGDVVKSVNGLVVTDFIGALRAYFALRNDKEIELVLMRDGKELRYRYEMVRRPVG